MNQLPTLSGPSRKPRSGNPAKQLVVLLHGWGADGANLIDLADMLAPTLPDAHFVAPNAPFVCEVNPFGYQWFSLQDRHPQHMLDGTRKAAQILNVFLAEQLTALKLEGTQLALVGFSQGTMTALHVAMRRIPQVAAVVGFSGAMIGAETLSQDILARPPVCLIHGQSDDVVPFASMAHAEQTLKAHGVNVESHPRPFLGHSIDMEGLQIASAFLKSKLLG